MTKNSSYRYSRLWFFIIILSMPASAQQNNTLIINKLQKVPVICYHQVRDWNDRDPESAKTFIMPTEPFEEQIRALREHGYTAILPEDLINYVNGSAQLPSKPIMITFDDGTASQYINALPILDKYKFKATFFIMTVAINKAYYLSTVQIKNLAHEGHVIGCHTWDHHTVTHYLSKDWEKQLTVPTRQLEEITGSPVLFFAYPFGSWDENAVIQLKKAGYKAAFQLSGGYSKTDPQFTVKRIIADGHWNAQQLLKQIQRNTLSK